jgi:hypothetical protein
LTEFELDQRARQRVVDFLSYRPEQSSQANAETQGRTTAVCDPPASIAQQTAADLLRFLSATRD